MTRWGALAAVICGVLAYTVGFQHGKDRSTFDRRGITTQTVVADYPYAEVCSVMLEAAWSIEDVVPPPLSPHKP